MGGFIASYLIRYILLIVVLSIHEYAHAWMADRCGDSTARMMGRKTLNPLAHIDPIGTVLIPLSPLLFSLMGWSGAGVQIFGWGKPVPVNPVRVRRWRTDNMLISLAGPASNLLTALAATVLLRVLTALGLAGTESLIRDVLVQLIRIAVFLGVFNLVPIPPLDGYHILRDGLRLDLGPAARQFESFGPFLLLFAINTSAFRMVIGGIASLVLALLRLI